MGIGRSKCRADGCKRLVVAKVMLTPPVENEKVPFIGLCGLHAEDWLFHLESLANDPMRYPQPFQLKEHQRRDAS
jgi:hypothetical protein